MPIVYLGIGSNLGEREKNIANAIMLLERHGVSVLKQSSIIETEPAGCPPMEDGTKQPKYMNAAIKCGTNLPPAELLNTIHLIEKQLGRVRAIKNAARTIDIDILLYDDLKIETKELTIPHPRMSERDFVKIPLKQVMD